MKVEFHQVTVGLEDQEFLDIIDTARYMMIWCPKAIVDEGEMTYTVYWFYDAEDESKEPQDDGDTQTYKILTKAGIEQAIGLLLTGRADAADEYVDQFRPDSDGDIWYDSIGADIVVQLALWGRVIFG